jgi:hypothetical protein
VIPQPYCAQRKAKTCFCDLTKEQTRNKRRTLCLLGEVFMLSFLEDAAELASLSCFLAFIAVVVRGFGLA